MVNERALFLREFVESPRKIGSVTPSSKYLTNKMLKKLPWNKIESIVELGAGTGVFTQYIIDHKQAGCKVVAVEQDKVLYERLMMNHPSLLMGREAENLVYILYKHKMGNVDCIVCGIPFANLAKDDRERIISAASGSLKRGGTFVMFQYSLQMRSMLKRYFSEVHIGLELRNFPPAFVYVCKK